MGENRRERALDSDFGTALPRMSAEVPGPASRELARRLAAVESPNVTALEVEPPIFWEAARGANVRDVDGNVYVDVTSGFAVTATGHANPRVTAAIGRQAETLAHGLGDIYPPQVKVELLERLAELAPGDLGVTILGSAGAEAVEAAMKTAIMHTGRPGIVAFEGGYHGLTLGALAVTSRSDFREPFLHQIYTGVRFAPYPNAFRQRDVEDVVKASLDVVRQHVEAAESTESPIGAVLVEPIQGRGGMVVPPDGFLQGLRELSDEMGLVLIFDEIYVGFGRTGRWFASEHWDVVPDILTVGKGLTGTLPLSATIGTREVMASWPPSRGEAIHTSTFLGNPIACAAALAQIEELEEARLIERAATLGERLRERLEGWKDRFPAVGDVRGLGLFQGVELVEDRETRAPAAELAGRVIANAMRKGVLMIVEGPQANVLAFLPPLSITEEQLDLAIDVVEDELAES